MYSDEHLFALDGEHSSWGDTVHYLTPPVIFRESDGVFLIDAKGQRFLDLQSAHCATNFGLNNSEISDYVKEAIDRLPMIAAEFLSEDRVLVSALIDDSLYRSFGLRGRTHLNVGGSNAIDDAEKMVVVTTGKQHQLAFEGAYHGRGRTALRLSSSYRYRRPFGFTADSAQYIPFPDCYRCPYGMSRDSCDMYCMNQVERLFESEAPGVFDSKDQASKFGAMFVEPFLGTGGFVLPPEGYLSRLKQVLDQHGILLVADEIQSGFFRSGRMWAMEHHGVAPDIVVFGKSLTNGLSPLSGVWARNPIGAPDTWKPGYSHSTYGGHPVGVAAAKAVLSMLERERSRLEFTITEKGRRFRESLRQLQREHQVLGHVDAQGLAVRIEITNPNSITPRPDIAAMAKKFALSGELWNTKHNVSGLVLNVGGQYKNSLIIAPSLFITSEELDLASEMLDQLFRKLKQRCDF